MVVKRRNIDKIVEKISEIRMEDNGGDRVGQRKSGRRSLGKI